MFSKNYFLRSVQTLKIPVNMSRCLEGEGAHLCHRNRHTTTPTAGKPVQSSISGHLLFVMVANCPFYLLVPSPGLKVWYGCLLRDYIPHYFVDIGVLLLLPTAYVVRREGNVLTRVCPSFCLSTPGVGGTPVRSRQGVPLPGPGRGVPLPGSGDTPAGWVPHLDYPPIRPGVGGTPTGGTPPQVPPSDLAVWGTLTGGTPPQVPPHCHLR